MKKILLLGAGMVAGPAAAYLLEIESVELTVASRTKSKAETLVNGHPRGTALELNVNDTEKLKSLVADHDLVISLLPYIHHVAVAELCLEFGKHMATTSYIGPEMEALDAQAKEAGLLFLNEIGVDPGIDHMSAMRIIDMVHGEGGKIGAFYSFCGGLPAPEDNDNPFGYKFSWSPRGVLLASRNSARFLEDGEIVELPSKDLFGNPRIDSIEGLGDFEVYPNRDSTSYSGIYGIPEARTCMRGTYRNLGWCATMSKMVALGYIDESPQTGLSGLSFRELTAKVTGVDLSGDIRTAVARKAGLAVDDPIIERLDWLGLFSDDAAGTGESALDMVCDRMQVKMGYSPGQRDLLLMRHVFIVENSNGTKDEIISTMIDYGITNGDSSMSRTVGLPLAVGVRHMIEGKFSAAGVVRPVTADMYIPVLDTLETLGISLEEKRRRLN